jgi:hypothetical protein
MRGPIPPLEGADRPSLSPSAGRVRRAWPRLMCDSGRARAWGERREKNYPILGRRRSRLDPHTPTSEILAAPPVATRLMA